MKFLPLLRAHLSGAGQPVDRGRPFRLRRLDVAHEAGEMLDQRLRDLPQARIGNVLPALKHHIRAVVFGHRALAVSWNQSFLNCSRVISCRAMSAPSTIARILPNAISRGRYFLAAEATGASVSFPLTDTVFDTSFPFGCSIIFRPSRSLGLRYIATNAR
jgi:hypothetical protein